MNLASEVLPRTLLALRAQSPQRPSWARFVFYVRELPRVPMSPEFTTDLLETAPSTVYNAHND
ncbi:MAG: hypothetical protein ABL907_22760, partial [Hyphomicrobium sp.]